ncbi:MAG: RNA repair domain-containing protein [Thermoplasmata archaeon]|nr:RNA repair domain-containing protein [Thermoplasmata archaeon]
MTPKQVIDKLRWDPNYSLKDAEIWFWDRMAPTGERGIRGSEIVAVESGFLVLKTARIPLYKIFKIVHRGEVIFERGKKT